MTSTIPTIHEELGRLRQADILREARRCALARDAASASKRRRARRGATLLALPLQLPRVGAGCPPRNR